MVQLREAPQASLFIVCRDIISESEKMQPAGMRQLEVLQRAKAMQARRSHCVLSTVKQSGLQYCPPPGLLRMKLSMQTLLRLGGRHRRGNLLTWML